jgi:hypothetical protein
LFLFTAEEGNLLIRLLLAHVCSDFILQTSKIVENKKWFSKSMGLHIGIVLISTYVFGGVWKAALAIGITHWLIDGLKMSGQRRYPGKTTYWFIGDQLLHLFTISVIWAFVLNRETELGKALVIPFTHYKPSLMVLGYATVIWPAGYLIKFATQHMAKTNSNTDPSSVVQQIEDGGRLIGQFERIIILTFVLLGQYEAIGFLITGKSIIRFASREEHIRSEYVLVGTMMSYAFSILAGVCLNWLLHFA